ncbi:MAG: GNAT family N-acetyltransferase [Lachnospirales bacterium]
MEIIKIEDFDDKKEYMDLLLIADEQENMIYKYLERGEMYAIYDNGVKCVCVVTFEGDGVLEIQNIATNPIYQHKGYGKKMMNFIFETYKEEVSEIIVGTGESPANLLFYECFGFEKYMTLKNFFAKNYDLPIYEGGMLLKDKIYLKKYF